MKSEDDNGREFRARDFYNNTPVQIPRFSGRVYILILVIFIIFIKIFFLIGGK